ncbi:MAG: sigma-70 family RNA polymerase sigma factor [Planctomycetota bacterium]|nr:sigma-70 family RNA polymerase sigma factor [Planctomycetota bacterium]
MQLTGSQITTEGSPVRETTEDSLPKPSLTGLPPPRRNVGGVGALEEKSLIQSVQNGDNQLFSEIVTLYQNRLYNLIYRLVNNPDDALDVCQEVFLKACCNIKSFRGESSFLTYLYRIAFNESIIYRNKRQRIKLVDLTGEQNCLPLNKSSNPHNSAEEVQSKEQSEHIQSALNSLEPELKEVVLLKDVEELSYADVAKTLGISVSTVRTGLDKARAELRIKLKELIK